jgi:hypothetical protein
MTLRLVSFIAALVLIGTAETFGQKVFLSGYTRDSVTFDLLPYTTIHTTKGKPLAASNENGYFSLTINPGDTIVFTRLGYKPVKIAPAETSWDMNVMIPETAAMLHEIVVYDNYIIHGHEQIQKALKEGASSGSTSFKNQTVGPNATNLIPTFGPGVVINGALSKLLGVDRERRKVSASKAELIRTQVYYEVIQSPTTKQYVSGLFNLSEDEYNKSLQKFKTDYPSAVYLQSREEIIRLMVESFATKR